MKKLDDGFIIDKHRTSQALEMVRDALPKLFFAIKEANEGGARFNAKHWEDAQPNGVELLFHVLDCRGSCI